MADANARSDQARFDALVSRRNELLADIDQLIADSTDASLPAFKRRVVEYLNPLLPLEEWDLKGYGNPYIRARVERGKQEHTSRQSSFKVKELEFDCRNPVTGGSRCRLDYMKGCTIIEIKPRNKGAEAQGWLQVAAYKEGLEAMYAQKKEAMFTGDFALLAPCARDGKLNLSTDLETYDFCPSDELAFTAAKESLDTGWEPAAAIGE
jgi:hypothetical protein